MRTVRDVGEHFRDCSWNLRNPLAQPGPVWASLSSEELLAGQDRLGVRWTDPGGILALTEQFLGAATRWAVLGDNVAGVMGWTGVTLAAQYDAVRAGAGVFVTSTMFSLRVSGRQAGVALDRLAPRRVSDLEIDSARFILFTTPAGTVDEEAVVIRIGPEEFLMSCGGGKPPGWLSTVADEYGDDVVIQPSDLFSFNIKGPKRLTAILSLIQQGEDAEKVSSLSRFGSCVVRPLVGGQARILKNLIGYEVWADIDTLVAIWRQLLTDRPEIMPCGWDLLNIYRLECRAMVFGLYPLEIHSGTSLLDVDYGWMVNGSNGHSYLGQEALSNPGTGRRLWLAGLRAVSDTEPPLVGCEVLSESGSFRGYVTSSAFSPRDDQVLAFAHLLPDCIEGDEVRIDEMRWTVSTLPFGVGGRGVGGRGA